MEEIRIVFEEENLSAAAYDGDRQIGECDVQETNGTWSIVHTGVREEYGGRGLARKLVDCVVTAARERNVKIIPSCSYAEKVMTTNDTYSDVLA